MEFTPDESDFDLNVPYFEDASNADGVIGYSTTKSQKELKALITSAFGRLNASVTDFQSGKFGNRYGFRISFNYNGVGGRLDVCALPIAKETESKIDKAKRHALYSVLERLKSYYNSMLVMPGDVPLIPYMLNDRGVTLLEYAREINMVASLPEPTDYIIEGEYSE